jgi:hypothetical protein
VDLRVPVDDGAAEAGADMAARARRGGRRPCFID